MERRDRRGNYSIVMGFSVVGIVGFGALGVDLSYMALCSDQAQSIADAAAHAAMLTYRGSEANSHGARADAAKTAARWVVENNRVGLQGTGEISEFSFGLYDTETGRFSPGGGSSPNGVKVAVARKGGNGVDTLLAGIIGEDSFDVEQSGTAAFASRDVMMVVDLSGSMYQGQGTPFSRTGGESEMIGGVRYAIAHEAVRDAMVAFTTYSVERRGPGDRVGVSAFAENSVLWQPATRLDLDGPQLIKNMWDWGVPNAAQGGRVYSGDKYAVAYQNGRRWYYGTSGTKRRGLAYGRNRTDDCQDVMDVQFRWEGWNRYPDRPNVCDIGTCTNPGPAVDLAVKELVNGNDSAFKAIIVLSDGMPTCGEGASGLLSATERAWNDHGIHVWTVAYDGSDGIDAALMEKAAKGLGSYEETPKADRLRKIMVGIAEQFPIAIVE